MTEYWVYGAYSWQLSWKMPKYCSQYAWITYYLTFFKGVKIFFWFLVSMRFRSKGIKECHTLYANNVLINEEERQLQRMKGTWGWFRH